MWYVEEKEDIQVILVIVGFLTTFSHTRSTIHLRAPGAEKWIAAVSTTDCYNRMVTKLITSNCIRLKENRKNNIINRKNLSFIPYSCKFT